MTDIWQIILTMGVLLWAIGYLAYSAWQSWHAKSVSDGSSACGGCGGCGRRTGVEPLIQLKRNPKA